MIERNSKTIQQIYDIICSYYVVGEINLFDFLDNFSDYYTGVEEIKDPGRFLEDMAISIYDHLTITSDGVMFVQNSIGKGKTHHETIL